MRLAFIFAITVTPAFAADLPVSTPTQPVQMSWCRDGILVPMLWGGLTCQGAQYGGGTANVPGPSDTHTVTTHTPPTPPSPPSDPCGPKGEGGDKHHGGEGRHHGGEGRHGGHHGQQ